MRKTYSKEFKLQVCHSITTGKHTVTEVANQYAISRPIVSRWLAEYKRYSKDAFTAKGVRLPEGAKVYALEKEIKRLQGEDMILKKFSEFAKNPKR